MVNKPTHISESFIDHVCIKKTLIEELSTNATVENINFWDHDSIRIVIEKNNDDFHTVLKTPVWSGKKEEFYGCLGFLLILIHLAVCSRWS